MDRTRDTRVVAHVSRNVEESRERLLRRFLARRLPISRPGLFIPLPNPRGVPDTVYEKFIKVFELMYNSHDRGMYDCLRHFFKQDVVWLSHHYTKHKKALLDGKNPFGSHESLEFTDLSLYFKSVEVFHELCPDATLQFTSFRVRYKGDCTVFRATYQSKGTVITRVPVPKQKGPAIHKLMECMVPPPGHEASSMKASKEEVDEVRQIIFDAQIYDAYNHPDKVLKGESVFDEHVGSSSLDGDEMLVALPVNIQGYALFFYDEIDHLIRNVEFHYYEPHLFE